MAESIISGLFGLNPYEVQQQRNEQDRMFASSLANMDAAQRGVYGLAQGGAGLARIGAGMMGMVDPVEEESRQLRAATQGADTDTPEGLRTLAKRLQSMGMQEQAMMVATRANEVEAEKSKILKQDAEAKRAEAVAARELSIAEKNARDKDTEVVEVGVKGKPDYRQKALYDIGTGKVTLIDEPYQIAAGVRVSMGGEGHPKTELIKDETGKITLVNTETGATIKKLDVTGTPSATYQKTVAAEKKLSRDLNLAISNLEEAVKDGGLIDQSTGSGIGAAVDYAAKVFGVSTPGAIAVGAMAPIYDLVLKMVPRFEGPQSDKDTASYERAAGQLANPDIPKDIKKAAAKEILRLMKERNGQFTSKDIIGTELDTTGGSKEEPQSQAAKARAELERRRSKGGGKR